MRKNRTNFDQPPRQPLDALPADRLNRAMTLLRRIRASGQKVVVAYEGDVARVETVTDLFMAGHLLPGTLVKFEAGNVIVLPVSATVNRSAGAA